MAGSGTGRARPKTTPQAATPFRVTAHMLDGRIAINDPALSLDSMLAWAWMMEHYPEEALTAQASTKQAITPDLSAALARARWHGADEADWFWACSWGRYRVLGERVEYWHKRFDQAEAERFVDLSPDKPGGRAKSGRVVLGGGPYKAWRIPVPTSLVAEIQWHCLGYPDEVRGLLQYLPTIGKHRRSGWGAVREWAVEPCEADLSVVDDAGRLMRAVPDPKGTEVRGIRPPYWAPGNQRLCRVPVREAETPEWYEAVDGIGRNDA